LREENGDRLSLNSEAVNLGAGKNAGGV